jgi:hypothetical protein
MVVRTEGDLSDSRASAALVIMQQVMRRRKGPILHSYPHVAAQKNTVLYVMQGPHSEAAVARRR